MKGRTWSYLIKHGDENKKAKSTKIFAIKNLKFEDYKNSLEVNELKNKINHQDKNDLEVYRPWQNHNELIKNNRLILKPQHISKSEKHNVFTEEVRKLYCGLTMMK